MSDDLERRAFVVSFVAAALGAALRPGPAAARRGAIC